MAKTDHALVVADAGPLIHLDELDALDVLSDFKAVLVPNAVWIEVQHHRLEALENKKINLIRQTPPPVVGQIKALATMYTLHHGEREALTQCLMNDIKLLITDDTAARLAAKSLNIAAHGTISLLIRSVRKELRKPSDVLTLLTAIPQKTTLHIRPSLLNDVISRIKAEWELL